MQSATVLVSAYVTTARPACAVLILLAMVQYSAIEKNETRPVLLPKYTKAVTLMKGDAWIYQECDKLKIKKLNNLLPLEIFAR